MKASHLIVPNTDSRISTVLIHNTYKRNRLMSLAVDQSFLNST